MTAENAEKKIVYLRKGQLGGIEAQLLGRPGEQFNRGDWVTLCTQYTFVRLHPKRGADQIFELNDGETLEVSPYKFQKLRVLEPLKHIESKIVGQEAVFDCECGPEGVPRCHRECPPTLQLGVLIRQGTARWGR